MKATKLVFATVMGAALVGCAADGMGPGTGDDEPPIDPPVDPPIDEPRDLDATGNYRIHSKFDLAQNMPGTVGSAVNSLIAMTDDPNDPSSWILVQLINQLEDGFFKDLLLASEPFVASELNAELINFAPDLVETLLDVGGLVNDISKNFGLGETLVVSAGLDGLYTGNLTIDAFELTIDSTPQVYKFTDYQLANINATQLPVTLDATKRFSIGQHQFPIPYGTVLRIGLDEAIIPAIDPGSQNLGDLLNSMVNCQAVGQEIADALGFGGAAIYAGACVLGLEAAADAMYDQIAGIDSAALEFDISGTSTAVDLDADYKVDRLDTGVWTGTLSYSGDDAALGPATFTGTRITTPQ